MFKINLNNSFNSLNSNLNYIILLIEYNNI